MRTATVVAVLIALAFAFPTSTAVAGGVAPTADAGGPYFIDEGDSLGLNAAGSSGPEADGLTYAWDLDNDGQYDDATGVDPVIPWELLAEIGIDDDGGFTIGVEVDDGTSVATGASRLTIANTRPVVTLRGAAVAAAGVPYRLSVLVDDPGADTIASWIVNWGDGGIDTGAGLPDEVTNTYAVDGLSHGITVQVTDEDGTWTTADVALAYGDTADTVGRHDTASGAKLAEMGISDGSLSAPHSVILGPDGMLYVSGRTSDTVVRYDPGDNSFVGSFVSAGAGGLSGAKGIAFGPDGNLYVASSNTAQILRYNGTTGAFIDIFVDVGTLSSPGSILFAPDSTLLVADEGNDDIEQYDATTGAPVGVFAAASPGDEPAGVAIGPNGNLFVAMYEGANVKEFDAATGALVNSFVTAGLSNPHSLLFGPDGDLWVSDYWVEQVKRFDGSTGADLGPRITEPSPAGPFGFTFLPDHRITVVNPLVINSTADSDAVERLSGEQWRNTMAPDAPSTPLTFEENIGQADPSLDFIARGKGYIAILSGGEAVLTLGDGYGDGGSGRDIRMEFIGGAADPAVTGADRAAVDGTTADRQFGSVEYTDVYPGTDVIYSANGRELEYTFVIAPGADPNLIKIDFDGVTSMRLEADGSLLIDSESGPDLRSTAPVTYQELNGKRLPVNSSYVLHDNGTVGFGLGDYEPALPLIIDPTFLSVEIGTSISTSLTIAAPVGLQAGDLLVAQVTYRDAPPTISPPADWVLIRVDSYTDRLTQWAYYKVATGSEPANYTFGFSVADDSSGAIGAFRDIDIANPIDAHSGQGIDDGPAFTAPSITTTVANTTLVGLFGNRGGDPVTPPAGMTERWDVNGSSASEGADEAFAAVGPTGTRTASNPGKEKVAQLIALRPAPLSVVNSTGDGSDTKPGNGICDTGGTNSQGATECTLRAAIEEANATAGTDTISFAIPITEPGYSASPLAYTITPGSGYPDITDPVILDATTQPDHVGDPIIQLDGSSAVGSTAALVLETDDSTINGFIVHGFPDEGLEIDASTGGGQRNTVSNNWVGIDADKTAQPNGDVGVLVTVGAGDNTVSGNVISSNTNSGLVIRNAGSDNNIIQANLIGVAPDGVTPRPNGLHGVEIYDLAASNLIGGTGAAEGNTIVGNIADGVSLATDAGSSNAVLRNTVHSNGGLGVDLGNDGVTANDGGDGDTGANDLLNHPVVSSAVELGGTITLAGTFDVPAGNYRFEFFKSPSGADPSGNGEGEQFVASSTLAHTGSGAEPWGAAFPGAAGDIITVTVTEDFGAGSYGSTSEFSAASTATANVSISGTVFEDVAGDVLADGIIGDVNNPGTENVDVYLYLDDGNTFLGATDTLIGGGPTQTDSSGDYSFTGLANGDYFVVIDSKTVAPNQDPIAVQTDIWAEQTWGPIGGYCDNGVTFQIRVTAGPCYAGITDTISDDFSQWDDREHRAAITVSGADVTNVHFGFSFNVVTTVSGGDSRDDDGAANRTVQGSLRQFIQNANAIAGANTMRFVPVVGVNRFSLPDKWWGIRVTNTLPVITGDGTTIDGTAYNRANGTTVQNTNNAQIGAGVAVGTARTYTTPKLDPELEIWNDRSATIVDNGLVYEASDAVLRNTSVWGFGNASNFDANVRMGTDFNTDPDFTGSLVELNVIGTGPASFTDPGVGNRSTQKNVTMRETDNAIVRDNLIGFTGAEGVNFSTASNSGVVLRNELRRNGLLNPAASPVSVWITGSITGNLITDNAAGSFSGPTFSISYLDNTITANGWGASRSQAIWVSGSSTSIRRNIIANNDGAGVVVQSSVSDTYISQNSIYGNGTATGQIGIDLLTSGDDPDTAPYVTINDSGDGDTGANGLINFPIIEDARIIGSDLVVTGWALPGASVELYLADPDPAGFGQGKTWLITLAEGSAADSDATSSTYGPGLVNGLNQGTDTTNRFRFQEALAGLNAAASPGLTLTATGRVGSNVSEFSGNVTIVTNGLPTADAGGPYGIDEGDPITLDGSASTDPDTDPLSYEWDLDNNGSYGDVTGVNPTVTWATLVTYGIDDDGAHTVGLRVDDSISGTATDTAIISVANTAPVLSTTGAPAASAGWLYTLTLGATDPGADIITGWMIDWGDGSLEAVAGNPPTVTHTYTGTGITYNILAAATDEDGTYRQNDLIVPSYINHVSVRYDANDWTSSSTLEVGQGIDRPYDVTVGPDGDFYVTGYYSDDVLHYDGGTGLYIEHFVTGVARAVGLEFGPDGNLYVAAYDTNDVQKFDGATGAPLGPYVTPGSGGLTGPTGITFGPDGNLYVSGWDDNAIYRYDGATGASLGTFIVAGSGGLTTPEDLVFGPDGNLYIADPTNNNVKKYHGTTGASLGVFTSGFSPSGAIGLAFGPDRHLYVASYNDDGIHRFDMTTGAYVDTVISAGAGGIDGPAYFTFVPDQQVLVDALVINSTGDSSDATPGNGACDTGGTNTDGDAECTLRAAIEEANALAGSDAAVFDIPTSDPGHAGGVWRISPVTAIPALTAPLSIDGSTQPGFVAPIIQIDGGLTPVGTDGFVVGGSAGGSTIRAVAVVGFPNDGFEIGASAGSVTLTENYVGVNADGVTANGNGDDGITNNGAALLVVSDNVVSANASAGVQVEGSGMVVTGNKIGVGSDGFSPMGNGDAGIFVNDGATSALIGGTAAADANIVANNAAAGIVLDPVLPPDDVAILRNVIHSNGGLGIDLSDDGVTANDSGDGDSGANDLLNFPAITTAYVVGGTVTVDFDLDTVAGDYRVEIFTNPSGADPSGYGEGQTFETSYAIVAHPGGNASYTTVYSGAPGDIVTATATEDLGAGNYGSTSELSPAVTVVALAAMVNSTGDAADATPGDETCDTGALNSEGDPECTLRAAIEEANASAQIDTVNFNIPTSDPGHAVSPIAFTITPVTSLPAISDTVTLDASTQPEHGVAGRPVVELVGTVAAGNGLETSAGSTEIRGFVINRFVTGIAVLGGTNNLIAGNYLGPDVTAAVGEVGNSSTGITVAGATNTMIGGSTALDRNIISGNRLQGVLIDDLSDGAAAISDGTTVWGNYIGTDAAGTAALPYDGGGAPQQIGIALLDGPDNIFGGATTGQGNVLSANSWYGLYVFGPNASNNTIRGNIVGLDATATSPLGNGADNPITRSGVYIGNAPDNTVGGTGAGEANTVAGNDAKGIIVSGASATGNAMLGNAVYNNAGVGIDLELDGVTANDAGDGDAGANDLLNFPEIVNVRRIAGDLVVDVELDVPAGNHRIELFANTVADPSGNGEGETLLGATTVSHTGSGVEAFTVTVASPTTILTATTTEDLGAGSYGSTSELSLAVPSPDLVVVNSTGDGADASIGDGQCDTGALNSGGNPECALRAAIEEANDPTTPVDTVWFAIPATDPGHSGGVWTISPTNPLPAISATTTVSGRTQPGHGANTTSPLAGLDGTQVIVIDGSSAGVTNGLTLDGTGIAIDGLVIGGFDGHGIEINGGATVLADLYLGTDATGAASLANTGDGLHIVGDNAVIGSALAPDRVLVSGNDGQGIEIIGSGVTVLGSIIGLDSGATTPLPNGGNGIRLLGSNATIGAVGAGNAIAHNGGDGVQITGAGDDVAVVGNVLVANTDLAIDLGADGVTANDAGDGDTGANDLLNTAVITSAVESGGIVSVDYTLDVPAGDYRIELFTNPSGADPSGSGEAEAFATASTITHAGSGTASFSIGYAGAGGDILSISVTEDLGAGAHGSTSELSSTMTVVSLSSITATDSSRRRSDFRARGSVDPSSPVPALAGVALDFAGGSDRLEGPGLDLADGSLTFGAWVFLDTSTAQHAVVSKQDSGDNPIYELSVDGSTGEAVAAVRLSGSTITARGGSVSVATWHVLNAVWDGADLVLYVDAVEVDRVSAAGQLNNQPGTAAIIGNRSNGTRPTDGLIDTVRIAHQATTPERISAHYLNVSSPTNYVSVGAQQTSTPGTWTATATQSRSGSFALEAPETSGPDAAAWAVATGIDEPGVAFESWWWVSTDTAIDLSSGTRAGLVPTDQYEAGLVSPSGWELRHRTGSTETLDSAPSGAPTTGSWMKVEIWTDQLGDSRILIDGVEVTSWTSQGTDIVSGSLGLRTGLLPTGESWHVDDPRARKLITPEPVTSLGAIDRD